MKICLLAPANSIHTRRWAQALVARGHEVTVLTLHAGEIPGISVILVRQPLRFLGKANYLLAVSEVRSTVRRLAPDVLHAHYLSSYGLLGALAGFRPLVISVWGSDVYEFPRKSVIHRLIVQSALSKADLILSTSQAMARETQRYQTSKAVRVLPFGIDVDTFSPNPAREPSNNYVIGTVKALEPVYGVDVLLRGFASACQEAPKDTAPWRLVVVGGGSQETILRRQAAALGLNDRVTFLGKVPHGHVPALLRTFDVFVAVSRRESFGVAVLEASACGLPVVVSAVDGLLETVEPGTTGLVVPPDDPEQLASALLQLSRDAKLRKSLGCCGRTFVNRKFEWGTCVSALEEYYHELSDRWGARQ